MKGSLFYIVLLMAALTGLLALNCDSDPGLEPIRSGISGKIKFVGAWPENTDEIMVIASLKFPPTQISDLIMSESMPLFVDSLNYTLWAPTHQYGAVGLVWKEKGQPWNVTNIIGMYFPSGNQFAPGPVSVKNRGQMVENIDMVANFAYAKRFVRSKMTGTIHYKGNWPAGSKAALVVASPNSILSLKSLLELHFTAPLPVGVESSTYELSVPAGKYKTIGTLIISDAEPIGLNSVKALYIDPATGFPGQITVATDSSIVTGVDMTVNFGS